MSFAVTVITVDRSPKTNYLGKTLQNLQRSGVFSSPLLRDFLVIDSGSDNCKFAWDAVHACHKPLWLAAPLQGHKRTPSENAAYALNHASNAGAEWVLFLEDDIDVCGDFLESVDAWLKDYEGDFKVFPLGANYDQFVYEGNDRPWPYPVGMFYGTLAVAMRPATAQSLSTFIANAHGHTYDLHMAAWAEQNRITHFLTPSPSFVQHLGHESFIRPGSAPITYNSWPGKDWVYKSKVVV